MKSIDKLSKSLLQSKSKAAAIFLDKCNTTSKREKFIKQLQIELAKYNLTVDIFGKCGPLKCARKSMNACYYRLKTTYYFYLAFEDSIAPDYITTSVLNGYLHNTVPIVYGGAKYTKFLPPDSYIDASLLGETMLAKEMFEIIQNKEWYQDFFKWRNHYVIKEAAGMDPCVLCDFINHPAWLDIRASYVHLRKWWNPYFRQKCGTRKSYFSF
ncbi:alpha-(1,3)-fucosyltransferase C-like [Anticarsia gemmatalis]|uniref:alpha-(1,3)-fucosyltransferase C-like n=1 Tax=Anticarsia gemmatalis TaxID=129554 RepID=UPI003F763DE0